MATSAEIKSEIKGLKEVQKKMEQVVKDLGGEPFLNAMRRATILVNNAAKRNAPVDTGRLRASITPQVTGRGIETKGIVGTNVEYAARMEQPGPVRRSGRRPYLEPALTENEGKIRGILRREVGIIVRK